MQNRQQALRRHHAHDLAQHVGGLGTEDVELTGQCGSDGALSRSGCPANQQQQRCPALGEVVPHQITLCGLFADFPQQHAIGQPAQIRTGDLPAVTRQQMARQDPAKIACILGTDSAQLQRLAMRLARERHQLTLVAMDHDLTAGIDT